MAKSFLGAATLAWDGALEGRDEYIECTPRVLKFGAKDETQL